MEFELSRVGFSPRSAIRQLYITLKRKLSLLRILIHYKQEAVRRNEMVKPVEASYCLTQREESGWEFLSLLAIGK